MDTFDADQFSQEQEENLFYPFSGRAEWQFASWLANSGQSMANIDECLSLDMVCFFLFSRRCAEFVSKVKSLALSFRSVKALQKHIELLPSTPQWECEHVRTESPTK
ncbi:hypothetical protein BU15DRAFT_48175 [Melanogaster broomeanus]|nr:hypothetical protein BU15DRAFT_48175 [Melanogaster broomeanus]